MNPMNPTLDNTRLLGVGEQLSHADFIHIGDDFVPVGREFMGHLISGDEIYEFRRFTAEDPINAVARAYGIETDMGLEALKVAVECAVLLDSKQKDYGPGNISATGEQGVVTRIADKSARLIQLVLKNVSPNNESVEDSYKDTANYGIIGLLVRRGIWR